MDTPAKRLTFLRDLVAEVSFRDLDELAGRTRHLQKIVERASRGGNIDPDTARDYAKVFGVAPEWLLLGGPKPSRADVRAVVGPKVERLQRRRGGGRHAPKATRPNPARKTARARRGSDMDRSNRAGAAK